MLNYIKYKYIKYIDRIKKIFNIKSKMNNYGMMEGVTGMPSGKWTNKLTGKDVFVRDCIIDGDTMMIMTDHGQINMDVFSRDYIQVSDIGLDAGVSSRTVKDGSSFNTMAVQQPTIAMPTTETINNDLLLDDDKDILNSNQSSVFSPVNNNFSQVNNERKPQVMPNKKFNDMVVKLIDKCLEDGNVPDIDLKINWDNLPVNELKMLKEYFDVSTQDISEYINHKVLTEEFITSALDKFIEEKFLNVNVEEAID